MLKFITVSPHPTGKRPIDQEALLQYDIVINVSDHLDIKLNQWLCEHRILSYWFPLGESFGMPLENIFGALWVLWEAEKKGHKVLLHCVAGRNRSRMIKDCYRFMRTGECPDDSSMMLNIKDNQLPGIYRMEVFLQKCAEVFETPEIAEEAYVHWLKKETFGY